MSLHDVRFPGESAEYRHARDELLARELEVRRELERLAAMRRTLPLGGRVATDYVFQEWNDRADGPCELRLSELFAEGRDTLFVYSFMIVPPEQGLPFVGPCPSCTSIIDAVDGEVPHITDRINFAVVGNASIEDFRAYAHGRHWRHTRLLSPAGNTYNRDYGAETSDGHQWPMATVFVRRGDAIHHFWSSELFFVPGATGEETRHVDFMWPMWAIFDRTPDGRGMEAPKLSYGADVSG